MKETEALIEALKEWDNSLNPDMRVNDLKTIIFYTLFNLGEGRIFKDVTLDNLKERIDYLVNEVGISEDLIVMGCIRFISEYLEDTYAAQGERIVNMEIISKEPTLKEIAEQQLKKFKDSYYHIEARIESNRWNIIVANKFDPISRRFWDNERMTEFAKNTDDLIPKEVLEELGDFSVGKLMDYVFLGELKDMTVEQAREIAKKIKKESTEL